MKIARLVCICIVEILASHQWWPLWLTDQVATDDLRFREGSLLHPMQTALYIVYESP